MSRHAAFADEPRIIEEEKNVAQHNETLSQYDGESIAQVGTRQTGSEKSDHSEAGLVHQKETAKATRKLLLKMGAWPVWQVTLSADSQT